MGMVTRTTYELTAEVWRAEGPSDRYFVTLPDAVAADIRERFGGSPEAVGSLPISVALGQSIWSTSLYGDAASDSYVIPIKDEVRRRERVREAQVVTLKFAISR